MALIHSSKEYALPTSYAGRGAQDAAQSSYWVTDADPDQHPIDRSTQGYYVRQSQRGSDWADVLEHNELSVPTITTTTHALGHTIIAPQSLLKCSAAILAALVRPDWVAGYQIRGPADCGCPVVQTLQPYNGVRPEV